MIGMNDDILFLDFAENAKISGITVPVIVDHHSEEAFAGRFMSADLHLTAQTKNIQNVTESTEIILRGKTFKLLEKKAIDDGALTVLLVGEIYVD